MLDLLKVRYTGAGPEALMLCKDKALAKKVLAFHGVRSAGFVVSTRARPLRKLRKFRFPAFVKPLGEESSNGISKASYAKNEAEALERAKFLHESFECDALIEEYIEGRELTVSVLGNPRPLALSAARDVLRQGRDGRRRASLRDLTREVGRRLPAQVGHPERRARRASARRARRSSRGPRAWSTASSRCAGSCGSTRASPTTDTSS